MKEEKEKKEKRRKEKRKKRERKERKEKEECPTRVQSVGVKVFKDLNCFGTRSSTQINHIVMRLHIQEYCWDH